MPSNEPAYSVPLVSSAGDDVTYPRCGALPLLGSVGIEGEDPGVHRTPERDPESSIAGTVHTAFSAWCAHFWDPSGLTA